MHWPGESAVAKWRVLVELHAGADVTGVAHALRIAGLYDVEAYEIEVGAPALEDQDLIVMVDVGVPRSVLNRLRRARRQYQDKPIVVLSDDPAPVAASACLHAGANDFMSLPFIGYELLQRIFNCLSFRYPSAGVGPARESGFRMKTACPSAESSLAVQLNENDFGLTIGGVASNLTEVTFRVVEYLIQRTGTWVRSPELQQNAIGAHAKAGASNVRFHVHRAREQLQLGDFARYLHSWPRRGYMWSFDPCDTPHCQRAHSDELDRSDVVSEVSFAPLLKHRLKHRYGSG
jgi:DNA-binding response OmpR family regulator